MARDVTKNGPPTDASALLTTVDKAVKEGDVPKLAQIYGTSKDPVARVLAAMALERIHFNLEKSSEDARICEQSLIDSQPRIAFFCARFANGNLRLSLGSRQAEADELDIARRFMGKLPGVKLDELRYFVASTQSTPELGVDRPSTSFRIPIERSIANGRLPTMEVEANGQKSRLMVDTGSSFITLDPEAAKHLGVRMLKRSGMTGGFISRDIPVSYGILDKFTFAGVTVWNAPVNVIAGPNRLIGISVLRHLGAFRLGKDAITVYGDSGERPICQQPMLIASDVWGNALRVVTALSVDGTLRTTLLDSGTSFYLSGDHVALEQLHVRRNSRVLLRDMGTTQHAARVSEATADVDISGQPFEISFKVFKDTSLPWHYILGSGAQQYMDFYLDFETHHTCLLLHDNLH